MKSFEIPDWYKSPIISRVKAIRSIADKRKKDFSPSILDIGNATFILARHFGFCFGVENAIEISFKAIAENPGKKIYLLSQMIHNPGVNEDLQANGIEFIQDTHGKQLIPWKDINQGDVVIIPAFGTTLEIEKLMNEKGIDVKKYDTTCPFVQRVWKKSEKLGEDKYTVLIHGKSKHEETRATFSHTQAFAKSVVLLDMEEAKYIGEVILGNISKEDFFEKFAGRYSEGFDPMVDFDRIGVVNQTTMLASETQAISDYLFDIIRKKHSNPEEHFANTRDTLCYATNDNQSSTIELLNQYADIAIVVGGYNSSNTSHLVELLEPKFPTYFIKDETEIDDDGSINYFDIHSGTMKRSQHLFKFQQKPSIIVTSGASCPDATVDKVIKRITGFIEGASDFDGALKNLENGL